MAITKNDGLVLSTYAFNEADVIANILTKNGRQKVFFPGLKKSNKRDKAAMYLGSIISFSGYAKNTPDTLITISDYAVNFSPQSVSTLIEKNFVLQTILEFIAKTTVSNDPYHGIYEISTSSIKYLETTAFPLHLLCAFLARSIKMHGILPNFSCCAKCNKEHKNYCLDVNEKALIGLSCYKNYKEKRFASIALERNDVIYIQSLCVHSFNSLKHETIANKNVLQCAKSLLAYAESYFSIEIKSFMYLKNIFGE